MFNLLVYIKLWQKTVNGDHHNYIIFDLINFFCSVKKNKGIKNSERWNKIINIKKKATDSHTGRPTTVTMIPGKCEQ